MVTFTKVALFATHFTMTSLVLGAFFFMFFNTSINKNDPEKMTKIIFPLYLLYLKKEALI